MNVSTVSKTGAWSFECRAYIQSVATDDSGRPATRGSLTKTRSLAKQTVVSAGISHCPSGHVGSATVYEPYAV